MVQLQQFQGTPMYQALSELAAEMDKRHMPPVTLNVIGGFALMMRGVRPIDGVTDIDYIGENFSEEINRMIDQIGLKHGMGVGWINNDSLLTGNTMDSFELSTGELHFNHACTIGPISIHVLEEMDILRMKIIAVDTSMAELEATGEFARMKDFSDIQTLITAQGLSTEDVKETFEEYMICDETADLLEIIQEHGPEKASFVIQQKAAEIKRERAQAKQNIRSPFVDHLMDQLMAKQEQVKLTEEDLDFNRNGGIQL